VGDLPNALHGNHRGQAANAVRDLCEASGRAHARRLQRLLYHAYEYVADVIIGGIPAVPALPGAQGADLVA
jgi:hypothetical protein